MKVAEWDIGENKTKIKLYKRHISLVSFETESEGSPLLTGADLD